MEDLRLLLALNNPSRFSRRVVKGYKFHVFISYSRNATTTKWVRDLFAPTLRDYLEAELGERDSVYEDSRLEDGPDFDVQLYSRLSESALLVPLFTASYFNRDWCIREFAVMREREKALGIREKDDTRTLILPISLAGTDMLPDEVKNMQRTDFSRYYNAHLGENTRRREDFAEAVREWAHRAAATVKVTCDYREEFRKFRGETIMSSLRRNEFVIPVPSMITPVNAAT